MTPSNFEFGMSYGMLEEEFGEIVASDRLIESISEAARNQLEHGQPMTLDETWQTVVILGFFDVVKTQGMPEEAKAVEFLGELAMPLMEKLIRMAERVKVLHVEPDYKWSSNETFATSFAEQLARIRPTRNEVRPAVFGELREKLAQLFAEHSPAEARHSDMLAVFLFMLWYAEGVLGQVEDGFLGDIES